jgi:hypothetical protein
VHHVTTNTTPEKDLSATDKRNLEKIVAGDFAALKLELEQMAGDVKVQRIAEARSSKAKLGKDVEASKQALNAHKADFRAAFDKLVKASALKGVTVTVRDDRAFQYFSVDINAAGLDNLVAQVGKQVDADLARALNTLERQRLTVMRSVLLAGISSEADAVLQALPTAQSLMVLAATERSALAAR